MTESVKVAEFGETGAIVEVYQKFSESAQKIFFDVTCASERVQGSSRYLFPLLPIERVPHLVIAVLDAMAYISDRHKEIRDASDALETTTSSMKCYGITDIDPDNVRAEVSQVKEFKRGGVVAEIVVQEKGEVEVFSVCCWREHTNTAGGREREFLIQQRDLRDLCAALVKSWLYVHENWGSTPVTSRRW